MDNPWFELSRRSPYVLPEDRVTMGEFAGVDDRARIRVDVMPCPFLGSPETARVYLLNFNPSFKDTVISDEEDPNFVEELRRNLIHQSTFPFWALNPKLDNSSGYNRWSRKILRDLLRYVEREKLAKGVMCIQWFPYHSRDANDVRNLSKKLKTTKGMIPSQAYSFWLVREAIRKNRIVVLLRSRSEWFTQVPGLERYPVIEVKNRRRPFLSAGNMRPEEFERIVSALR